MKRGRDRKIILSNRLLYTLIAFGIILAITAGVYAVTIPLGSSGNPGHNIQDIGPPATCTSGQTLLYEPAGTTTWACGAGGSSSQWQTSGSGSDISYSLGKVDVNSNSGSGGYISSGNIHGTGTAAYFPSGIYVPQSATSWIYSDNLYLGTESGDIINFRGNAITGDASSSVTAGSFIYASDKAFKTNIQPLQNSLSKVQQLQGVSFNFKPNGEESIGFIAQDVEKVLPELVSGTEGSKGVAYGNVVAVLVEAIKEQQKQIDDLKAQLQEMKEN